MMTVISSMGPDNKRALDMQVGISTAVGAVAALAIGLTLGLGYSQGWEKSLALALSGGFLTGMMAAGAVLPFLPKKKEEEQNSNIVTLDPKLPELPPGVMSKASDPEVAAQGPIISLSSFCPLSDCFSDSEDPEIKRIWEEVYAWR